MWIKKSDGKLFDLSTGNSVMVDFINGSFMVVMVLTTLDLDCAKLVEYNENDECKGYEMGTEDCDFKVKVIEVFDCEESAQKYLDKLAEKLGAEAI